MIEEIMKELEEEIKKEINIEKDQILKVLKIITK